MSTPKRMLMIFCALLGLFFLMRGAWVAVEGLSGRIALDERDWSGILLFAIAGIGLEYIAFKSFKG